MLTAFETLKNNLQKNTHTWLITGVAGFIGSHLLETLLGLGQQVVGIDNFSTGCKENLDEVLEKFPSAVKNRFHFYQGDIARLEDCTRALEGGVEYVLHQAALGSVPRSLAFPLATHEANVTGFLNILFASKEAKVKRFIYASSSAVYGDSPALPKTEQTLGAPLSPYAASKRANELYAAAFATCFDIPTIGLRYFNVFGSRQNPEGPYAAVIPLWIESLLKNQAVYINGDGETSRDFCYVSNAVQANLLAAMTDNLQAANKIYNITFGRTTTLKNLFHSIAVILKVTQEPLYRDFRAGDIRHSLADIHLAKSELGYVPDISVAQGLEKTIDWFQTRLTK